MSASISGLSRLHVPSGRLLVPFVASVLGTAGDAALRHREGAMGRIAGEVQPNSQKWLLGGF